MSLFETVLGSNPYEGFNPTISKPDVQGWNGNHRALKKVIDENKPKLVFDVGAWKGQSTSFLANAARVHRPDVMVVAVDTWLGSPEHWNFKRPDKIHESLKFQNGYPSLYYTFLSNMMLLGLSENVLPLAQTTDNAAVILTDRALRANVIHIDAAHEYAAVLRDAENYWRLLAPGGILIGDDYAWPGVEQAAKEFAARQSLQLEIDNPKWILRKPTV